MISLSINCFLPLQYRDSQTPTIEYIIPHAGTPGKCMQKITQPEAPPEMGNGKGVEELYCLAQSYTIYKCTIAQ